MDHKEVGRYWDANADAWTELARAGYDTYRDHLNTPAFFEMLPDVRGLRGLDIGCGEGHNTRLLAQRGARMSGIDIAGKFIAHARAAEQRAPAGIAYHVGSAVELPYGDAEFDFAAAFMSLMGIPETGQVVAEARRVLRPGGFLQFSIAHPCFDTPHRRNLRNAAGLTYAIEVGDYFHDQNGAVDEWTFRPAVGGGKPLFRTPRFTRTLSYWLNAFIEGGFAIERLAEPRPSDQTVQAVPEMQDAQVAAWFLHVRVRRV